MISNLIYSFWNSYKYIWSNKRIPPTIINHSCRVFSPSDGCSFISTIIRISIFCFLISNFLQYIYISINCNPILDRIEIYIFFTFPPSYRMYIGFPIKTKSCYLYIDVLTMENTILDTLIQALNYLEI